MILTEQDLDTLSSLARIKISKEEKAKMLVDMQSILGYISEINEVADATNQTEIKGEQKVDTHAFFNIVREDVVTRTTGAMHDAILGEAPSQKNGYVKVEQVLK